MPTSQQRAKLDTPLACVAIAAIIGGSFVVLRLWTEEWDASRFVWAGDRNVHRAEAPPGLFIREDSYGFDGTGFYRFALDPFTRERVAYGVVLDHAAFRHQRIVYPLVVWAISGGGDAGAVPWVLIAVNYAGLCAIAGIGALIARRLGRHALWGLVFAAHPGFAVSLGLDTAEIVGSVFALWAVLLLLARRAVPATVLLTIAMLARETTLLVAAGAGVAWLLARARRREPPVPSFTFAVPAAAFALWQGALWVWWGELALASGSTLDIRLPLVGLVGAVPGWWSREPLLGELQALQLAGIVAFVAGTIVSLRRTAAPEILRWGAALAVALMLLLSENVWFHHWGYLRAFTEAYLLGVIVILADRRARADRVALLAPALWVSIAVNMILHP